MPSIPPNVRRAFRLPASRARLERELDDEVAFHLEQRIADLILRGMSPTNARAEAMRRFGDADDLRDYCHTIETTYMRRMRFTEWLESLLQDFHFASRQVRRSPGFALVVILTLALGLGATTAIFTVVDSVVLRPLPYPDAGRIVKVWEINAKGRHTQFSDPDFTDLQQQSHSFAAIAEEANWGVVSVSGTSEPTRANLSRTSRGFFAVMGVKPMLGRLFSENEQVLDGAPAAVISHGFWIRNFGGSSSALGTRLRLSNSSVTIVGVMPPELDIPEGTDLWVPRELDAPLPSRTAHNWQAVARLAPGVTLAQAQSEVSSIGRRIKQEFGDNVTLTDVALVPLRDELVGDTRPLLYRLLGASAILLLITCANVANLLIARMASRQGEVAVRLAIGAARGRLIQQFLIESLSLSLAAGVAGLLLAQGGVRFLVAFHPTRLPRAADVRIDWAVLAFAFAISVLVAVVLGVSSAWRGTRANLRDQLSQAQRTLSGAGSSHHLRSGLVVTQMALTLVLLVGAGLLARSLGNLLTVKPGFRTDSMVVLNVAADIGTASERARFYDDLTARLRAVPGVSTLGTTNAVPLSGNGLGNGTMLVLSRLDEKIGRDDFSLLGRDPERAGNAEYRVAGPGYFETMHIPLLAGRDFTQGDAAGAPHVAVVSASLAKQRWANGNPIGKIIQFGNMDGDLTPFTVIGVVGDVRESSLAEPPQPTFYATYRQRPNRTSEFNVVIGYHGSSTPIINAARQAVRDLRPDVPPRILTIEGIVAGSVTDRRFALFLVGVFGVVALVLAGLGVYSVISYLVTQRARELSIRVALGARGRDVSRLVLGQGARLAVAGIVLGTIVSLAASRVLAGMLYDESPTDPVAFAAVIGVLGVVAIVASYVPARRAARVEPMDVLRSG